MRERSEEDVSVVKRRIREMMHETRQCMKDLAMASVQQHLPGGLNTQLSIEGELTGDL